jgi:flavodoxin short chain
MKNTAVIYWSGTGNTRKMAEAVHAGAAAAGAKALLLTPEEVTDQVIQDTDSVALGCPAMASETLEESSFKPMFERILPLLRGKKAALFGSYGWGDALWMQNWEALCREAGIDLAVPSVVSSGSPDTEVLAACMALGKVIAQ